ncbi:MAG: hypothetical protein INR71_15250, partial [Terriglobus roseus]|nr:hypothetical protein [Terriglobus roseus]
LLDAGAQEGLDEGVDGLAGLHEQHHPPRLLELLHKVLDGAGANDGLALGLRPASAAPRVCASSEDVGERSYAHLILQETVDLCDCAVEGNDGEAMVGLFPRSVVREWLERPNVEMRTAFRIRF